MDDIFSQWRASLKRPKQRRRTYQHFDKSLDLGNNRDFTEVKHAIEHLKTHQFLPFLKFVKKDIRYRRDAKTKKPSRSLKLRPIMYASHLDAHIYGFYSYKWGQKYEKFIKENGNTENVIAYRKIPDSNVRNKGNIQFAREVFQYIQEQGECVAIVADISKFFDTLKHKILKERLCAVLGVSSLAEDEYKAFRSLTAFRFIIKDRGIKSEYAHLIRMIDRQQQKGVSLPEAVYEGGKKIIQNNRTEVGIPQGSPASGLLANIYLSAFDATVLTSFPDSLYRRYSDDVVLVCPTASAEKALGVLQAEIEKYALEINPSKAFFVKFERQTDGLPLCTKVRNGKGEDVGRDYVDYLGFKFDGRKVLLRDKTLQRAYKKTDTKIKKYHERQKPGFAHKKNRLSGRKQKTGTYMKNAATAMQTVGSKIVSQQEKFKSFVRKSKKNAKISGSA